MRKLAILSAIACCLAAEAAPVSAGKAASIASKVLPGIEFGAPRRAKAAHGNTDADAAVPYYVFNASRGAGYVIVAGDDRLPAVLGYSTEGTLDLDTAPEAMLALLDMNAGVEATDVAAAPLSAGEVVVAPLLGDINWGQDTPFNTKCPTLSDGKPAYVGCVATAMSQIMRFYGYPAKGTGSHSYVDGGKTLAADFGATTYDWANMPAVVPDAPTAAQTDAYSTLLSHIGVSVEMQYIAGGSAAYTMMVPGALKKYFAYSPSVRMHSRSYYNTDEWMAMIRAELDAGRPVYYAASSENSNSGHAFVCDGYDSEGFVHMNWGWYGNSNGYFYINHLNPGELGAGGGGGAYNLQQEILTTFRPAESGDRDVTTVYGATRFSADAFGSDMTFMTYFENLDTEIFNGTAHALLTDANDNIVKVLKSESITIPAFNKRSGAVLFTMRDVPVKCAGVADGSYRLHFGYQSAGDDAVSVLRHPIGLPGYASCRVAGGTIVFDGVETVVPDVEVSGLRADGDLFVNGSARFLAHVDNRSSNFRISKIALTLTNVADESLAYTAEKTVNIYDLSEADVTVDVDLPAELPEGDYKVTMCQSGKEEYPFAGAALVVTLLPERTAPVIRLTGSPAYANASAPGADILKRDHQLMFTLPLKNYGAAGETDVIMRLYPVDGAESKPSVLCASTREWGKGQVASVTVSATVRVDPGKYRLGFNYVGADGREVEMEGFDGSAIFEVEESDVPAFEVEEFNFPTQLKAGERVSCSIKVKSQKGYSGSLYVRVRRFTYSNGELAYMKSVNIPAGQSVEYTFNYRPGDLADGMYLVMVEGSVSGKYVTASGHDAYYREVALGDVPGAAVDEVIADDADGVSNSPVEWFDLQGRPVAEPTRAGLYIRRQGTKVEKKVIR